MMRIRFIADPVLPRDLIHLGFRAGMEVDLSDDQAGRWVRRGVAEIIGPSLRTAARVSLPPAPPTCVPTVACVLRTRNGKTRDHGVRGYTVEDVVRLRRAVTRAWPEPHDFVCLTDVARPKVARGEPHIEFVALESDWPGWWAKIELFRSGLFNGPVIYLDLDTVVCGPLDPLVTTEPGLIALDHANWRGRMNSGVMAWATDLSAIHARFNADPDGAMARYQHGDPAAGKALGDQGFLEEVITDLGLPLRFVQDLAGETFAQSYKLHIGDGVPGPETSIVYFHGEPKPGEVGAEWITATWAPIVHRADGFVPPEAPMPTVPLPLDWRRGDVIAHLVKRLGWRAGAELGLWAGATYLSVLERCPDVTLIGVDLWRPQPQNVGPEGYAETDHAGNERAVRRAAAAFGDRARIIKAWTHAAAAQVEDASLDFVFIDADHGEAAVRRDIAAWLPKLKPTGWLIGHDINWPGVRAAVDDLVPGYVIGPDAVWMRPVTPDGAWWDVCAL